METEKTKYMVIPRVQNAGENHDLLIASKSFENVVKFKCFGRKVTYQNCIHE